MGCQFSKMEEQPERSGSWKKWWHSWSCRKQTKVVPLCEEPPRLMKEIVFKDADPVDIAPPNFIDIESNKKKKSRKAAKPKKQAMSDMPSTSRVILADLRSSGIIMDTATPSGCSFEVPMSDAPAVARKPPARLAKLINVPKVKKTREQKEQELMTKLIAAEKRKQDLEDKFHRRMREMNLRRETNKTVANSNEDWSKCSMEAKMMAKEAVAATIKHELLQERLEKLKKKEERRAKVIKKKRSSRINTLKSHITRQNKVAPLVIPTPASPPTAALTTSTATSGNSSFGAKALSSAPAPAKALKDYTDCEWDSMFGCLT